MAGRKHARRTASCTRSPELMTARVEPLETRRLMTIAPDAFEPNDSFAAATDLGTLGTRTESGLSIHSADDDDYFTFVAAGTGQLTINVTFNTNLGDIDIGLYDSGQNQLATSAGADNIETITRFVQAGQRYYLWVLGYQSDTNPSYTVEIIGPPVATSPPDRFEPNDTSEFPTDLGAVVDRTESNLSIHQPNNDDWYGFKALATGSCTVTISFTHAAGDLDLEVYDADGLRLGKSDGSSNQEILTFAVTAGSNYYVRVLGFGGATNDNYSLHVSAPVPTFLVGNGATYAFGGTIQQPTLAVTGGTLRLVGDAGASVGNMTLSVTGTGTARIEAPQHLGRVAIGSTGNVTVLNGTGAAVVTTVLQMTPGGRFDLADGALILDDPSAAARTQVASLIAAAMAGGKWTGAGLTSVRAQPGVGVFAATTGVGYVDNAVMNYATFAGQNVAGKAAVLVRWAYYGDASLDGDVDRDDVATMLLAQAQAKKDWSAGNFNYDTRISSDDWALFGKGAAYGIGHPLFPAATVAAAGTLGDMSSREGITKEVLG